MSQTIVQGSEDPLLVLDHQGGSGNPSFEIQQDETAVALIWWDQVNQVFNMGPPGLGGPSLSIASDGAVSMGGVAANQLTAAQLVVENGTGASVTGGMQVDALAVQNSAKVAGEMQVVGGLAVEELEVKEHILVEGHLTVQLSAQFDADLSVAGDVSAAKFLPLSSREIKDNIIDLSNQEALDVLEHLSPVKFNYKADDAKKAHFGFIAEDVPRSVASSDGKSISLTDIVSVLTRVVKEQQKTIDAIVAKSH